MKMPNSVKWAGFTEKEWADKIRAGLSWCNTCRTWVEKMSHSNPSQCMVCEKARIAKKRLSISHV